MLLRRRKNLFFILLSKLNDDRNFLTFDQSFGRTGVSGDRPIAGG